MNQRESEFLQWVEDEYGLEIRARCAKRLEGFENQDTMPSCEEIVVSALREHQLQFKETIDILNSLPFNS